MGSITFLEKTYIRIFTKKKYIIVQCTVTKASRLINIFDHCYSRQCSLSMCRSQLSKAANLLLKSAFFRFCHCEFVYDTGSVYFTYTFMLYTRGGQSTTREPHAALRTFSCGSLNFPKNCKFVFYFLFLMKV